MHPRMIQALCTAALVALALAACWPQDPVATGALPNALALFRCTGWAGILLAVNFIAGAAALARALRRCSRANLAAPGLLAKVEALVQEGEVEQALALAREQGGYAGEALAGGLDASTAGADSARQGALHAATAAGVKVNAALAPLSLIGNVGPLLGLLGTVAGLLSAFHIIEMLKAPTPADMAVGMYGALASTAFGAFTALAFLTAYFLLKSHTADLLAAVNEEVLAVLAHLPSDAVPASR